MKLSQNWVGYLDRSYQQIKDSVIKRIVLSNPEITDHSEGNILIVILSFFSGIGEMINYYIDKMAQEAFLGTAKKYTSVVKLVRLIDYRIKACGAPTVNLLYATTDLAGNIIQTPNPIFIPKGTIIQDVNGVNFIATADCQIDLGKSAVYGPASQYIALSQQNLGTSDVTNNQQFLLPPDYVDATLVITINTKKWSAYTSFGQMRSNTLGFIVDIQDDGNAYVVFGDGINGQVPGNGQVIYGDYQTTLGDAANDPPNTITQITSTVPIPGNVILTVTNPDYASGGSGFETIDEIRDRAPRSIRTLLRAVTYQDYLDIGLLHPSVGATSVSYCCGKYVDVYIVPKTKGTATLGLIDQVQAMYNCAKMITTQVSVKPSGVSRVWFKMTLFGNPGYDTNAILIAAINALDENFGFSTVEINRAISISQVIRVLDSLDQIEDVEVDQVRVVPFARTSDQTVSLLNIEFGTMPVSPIKITYTLIYKAISDTFQVFKEAYLKSEIAISQTFSDDNVTFKINPGSYRNGDKWSFVVTPSYPEIFPNQIIQVTDNTAPIIDVDPLVDPNIPRRIFAEISVVTQGVSSNCLPPCN